MKEQMEAAKAAKVPEIPRKRFNVRTVAPLFGVIFVTLLFAILTKGSILKLSNIEVIINQAVFTILAGTGAVFVYAYGGIDLVNRRTAGNLFAGCCPAAACRLPCAADTGCIDCNRPALRSSDRRLERVARHCGVHHLAVHELYHARHPSDGDGDGHDVYPA